MVREKITIQKVHSVIYDFFHQEMKCVVNLTDYDDVIKALDLLDSATILYYIAGRFHGCDLSYETFFTARRRIRERLMEALDDLD